MKNIKKILLLLNLTIALSLIGCSTETPEIQNDTSTDIIEEQEEISENDDTYDSSYSYSDSSSSSSSSSRHKRYCEVGSCLNEGTYDIEGFSGETEYYCYTHYQEMQDIISDMEESVGSGSASKHICESCSKEGTHSIVGFSGETEYYCTEHYNEMVEILEMLFGE